MSQKSRKILKWTIPFAVLSFACATAGLASGCKPDNGHTHTYEWTYEEGGTEHWKACPADGVELEGSRGEHVFVGGECECGAHEPQVEKKYGSVKGTVKLHKNGDYESDYSDVVIDMGDDVNPVLDRTTGELTIANVEAGKKHTLSVSKPGYQTYSVKVQVEENQEVTLGGTRGIVLEYDVFGLLIGWDSELHDFEHANDADPYIRFKENEGGKTLNAISNDSYTDVAATLKVKYGNSTHDWHLQCVAFRFEDGKHLAMRYRADKNSIEIANNMRSPEGLKPEDTLFGSDAGLNNYGEKDIHIFTEAENTALKGEGLDLTAVLSDGKLYVLFNGVYVYSYQLPDGYAEKKAQIVYAAFDPASNAIFNYKITEALPVLESALDIDVTNPEDGTECTVTAEPKQDKYEFGEQIQLTFSAPDGYKLDTLTVNGEDKYSAVSEGKLTVIADRETIAVDAKFAKEEPVAIDITVKSKKMGTTVNLAQGTEVTLSGITDKFIVDANGKITGSVIKGRYTVSVDGYISKEIVIDENTTEITLEYDAFEVLIHDQDCHDFSHVNDDNPYIFMTHSETTSGKTFDVLTKEGFANVAATLRVEFNNSKNNMHTQGIILRYDDGKHVIVRYHNGDQANGNIQYVNSAWDACKAENTLFGADAGLNEWGEAPVHTLTSEETAAIKDGGLNLTAIINEGVLYVLFDGKYVSSYQLPEGYADKKVHVGYFAWDAKGQGEFHYSISETPSVAVAVTDLTEDNAGGELTVSQNVTLGGTVTVTVTPDATHVLDKLEISGGIIPEPGSDGTYTFVATEKSYTVKAIFAEKPAQEAVADVSGVDIGNVVSVMADGTVVTFTPENGSAVNLAVEDGKVKGTLLPGKYTAAVSGYYGVEVTVGEDGAFENLTDGITLHKIIFVYNFPKEGGINSNGDDSSVDYSKVASEGKLKATADCTMYEWLLNEVEGDKAFTVTLKDGNGTQAIFASFEDFHDGPYKHGVHYALVPEGDGYKVYVPGGEWFKGVQQNHSGAWELGNGEEYGNPISSTLASNYKNGTLTFTLARQGSLIYVILGNQILVTYNMGNYANNNLRFAVYAEEAKTGYEIPFNLEDTSDVLARISTAINSELIGYIGTWNYTEGTGGARNTVAVSGRGLATFKQTDAVKESLTFKLAAKNADGDQGIMYRFANGKYVAVRYQGGSNNHIQYTCDTTLFSDNYLVGWGNDFKLNEDEIAAVNGDGLDITYIRDGNIFYVYAGSRLLDVRKIGNEYAEAKGEMSLLIWSGKGVAFEYEHKTGDAASVPAADVRYPASVTVKGGDYHGYDVSLDKQLVKNGESVTLTIRTGASWGAAWSWFPSSVKVNGIEKFVSADMVSNSANHLTYTLTLDNITENTVIEVEITQGTTIQNGVVVTVKDGVGGTADSDSGVNGYYWNDGCEIYMTPEGGYEIESITVDDGEPVTNGWTYDEEKSRYVYALPDPITKPTAVVVTYKLVETTPEITE